LVEKQCPNHMELRHKLKKIHINLKINRTFIFGL
jgi:hypothetical protein